MSRRRIALLALIGIVPILIALWLAGTDIYEQMGRYVRADGYLAGETAKLHAIAFVDEAAIADVQPGQSVLVRVQSLGAEFPGTVREVLSPAAVVDPPGLAATPAAAGSTSRTRVPVLIDVEYGDAGLQPEMPVSVRIRR